jgi:hypothetical protein
MKCILGILAICAVLGADRLEVRAQGLRNRGFRRFSTRPRTRGRRLPADPGAHHGGFGWLVGQGLQAGDAGQLRFLQWPITISSSRCWPRAGVCRRPGGARPLFVRDSARARAVTAKIASGRLMWHARQLHLPGRLQRRCRPDWRPSGLTLPLMSWQDRR